MTDKEFTTYWGSNLKTCPKPIAERILTSAEEKEFLTGIGLPDYPSLLLVFEFSDEVLRYNNNMSIKGKLARHNQFSIGVDGDCADICIDGSKSGCLLSIDRTGEDSVHRFMNSSTRKFLTFLTLYDQAFKKLSADDEKQIKKCAKILEKQFSVEDNAAMKDAELCWWPVILEQRFDGWI